MKGAATCRGASKISHLFFVDDSPFSFFGRATSEERSNLEKVLESYEKVSGPQLNKDKTSLYFSLNTPPHIQDEINNRFGAEVNQQHEKYLGLPSLVGKNKCNSFRQLIERLDNKLLGWKEKLLSHVGKEILFKTIAQIVSTYTMSVFRCRVLYSMI